jgi:putative membrane protein
MNGNDPTDEEEPDVRFTYANERTFLAWNRTALALIATGIAATQLLPEFHVDGGRRILGLPMIALGALVAVTSYRHWKANERAMRRGEPLSRSPMPLVLSVGIGIVAAIAVVLALIGARWSVPPKLRGMTDEERDPGLARERTELAWNRSGLAALVAVTVLLRRLWPLHGYRSIVTLALIAAGAAIWAVSMRFAQRMRLKSDTSHGLKVSTARMLMLGTVVLAIAGFTGGMLLPN